MKLYVLLLFMLIFCSCERSIPSVRIDAIMNDLYARGDFNGALMIADNNQIQYAKGFGFADFDKKIAFDTSTTMDAASMTKTLTAMGIFILQIDNKLSI